jgi:hypothetical protein
MQTYAFSDYAAGRTPCLFRWPALQQHSSSCAGPHCCSVPCRILAEGVPRPPPPERPPFPPASVRMQPVFPAELGNELGPDVLMIWSFLHSFSDILGLRPASVDEILTAVALGERRWVPVPLQCCAEKTFQESMSDLRTFRPQISPFIPKIWWAHRGRKWWQILVVEGLISSLSGPSTPRCERAACIQLAQSTMI